MFRGKLNFQVPAVVVAALAVMVGGAIGSSSARAAAPIGEGTVIILVDASGSMNDPAGNGKTRMEAAKVGLGKVIQALPADSKVGLRAYGSTISDGPKSCKDSKLLVPVATTDKARLTAGVKKLKPLGNTPIAYSLKQAAKDLPSEGKRSIVLVSDGGENCNGDPCKVAKEISDSGTKLHVDVIGLQVDSKSRNQLSCIANAGGGTYFDVPDAINLPNTIKRLSLRAARGYAPAGMPVEGGTSAASAVKLNDGQWLDTIGDSGKEYYSVLDPGKGAVHIAATLRPLGLGTADGQDVSMKVTSAAGKQCGETATATGIGAFTGSSPITTSVSLWDDVRKECGKGPYVVEVDAPGVADPQPLSIKVISEPGVKTVEGLPPAAQETDFATRGTAFSSTVTPTEGSTSSTDAPVLAPGTYSDTILPGEMLYYRVDLDWGQQLVCDGKLAAKPAAKVRGSVSFQAQTLGFMGAAIPVSTGGNDSELWTGPKDAHALASTLPVRYLNRTEPYDRDQRNAVAGAYYCAFRVTGNKEDASGSGDLQLTFNASVVGRAGDGKPDYLPPPKSAEKGQKNVSASDDGGLGTGAFAGIGVGIILLLGLAWRLLRRRSDA